MINTEENSQNFKDSSKDLQINGVCILEMGTNGEIEVIFQKGIDIALVHHLININRTKILNNEDGEIKDYVGSLNAYLVYCDKNQSDKMIALFVDKEEFSNRYSKLDNLTESIFKKIGINTSNLEIKKIWINTTKFPRAKGLVGFLALNKTGILYFSRVKKNRKKISKNIFQIAGFISALLIYSKDLSSGVDPVFRVEDSSLGRGQV